MSASTLEAPLVIARSGINEACLLRRNVRTQPYGRCSVCTLRLPQCHAWQSSGYSYAIVMLALASVVVPVAWAQMLAVAGLLVLVAIQGVVHHRRTDELIFSEHRLVEMQRHIEHENAELERTVERRTSELRAANVELAATNLELLELDRLRGTLLANVSHELRTPLTSIRGAAQNMKDGVVGPLSPKQQEYVAIVDTECGRLIELVNQLLESARLEHGKPELSSGEVDLRALAEEVVQPLRGRAENRRITLSVDAADTRPVRVEADGGKLRQIVTNLVDNALKFTDEGGHVAVRVRPTTDGAAVEVEDDGVGVDADEAPRIFERFYRARRGADRPGTGLGLAIARNLARLHGGELSVRARPGAGSVFVLSLPRVAGAPTPPARAPRALPVLDA